MNLRSGELEVKRKVIGGSKHQTQWLKVRKTRDLKDLC